jgi:hypothetical protein
MSHYWHHMAHHARAMPHRNEFLCMKTINMSGLMSYEISFMGSIKTRGKYKTYIFEVRDSKEFI